MKSILLFMLLVLFSSFAYADMDTPVIEGNSYMVTWTYEGGGNGCDVIEDCVTKVVCKEGTKEEKRVGLLPSDAKKLPDRIPHTMEDGDTLACYAYVENTLGIKSTRGEGSAVYRKPLVVSAPKNITSLILIWEQRHEYPTPVAE